MKPVLAALLISLVVIVVPFGLQMKPPDDATDGLRTRVSEMRVGIMSGRVQGTYVRLAADLATLLEGSTVRVVPMIGRGSFQAIEDLMGLEGVDLAMFQLDVLDLYYRRDSSTLRLTEKVRYVTQLYPEEFHLLARADIESVSELEGEIVNLGPQASGTFLTSNLVFADLGINVTARTEGHNIALDQLRHGEIAAMARIAGQPSSSFRNIAATSGLHFLALPTTRISAPYQPARLTRASYPNLIRAPIETISTTALLAAYIGSGDAAQQARIGHFVKVFFANFHRLQGAGYHPKWREVDLSASVPGLKRLPVAEQALLEHARAFGKDRFAEHSLDTFEGP